MFKFLIKKAVKAYQSLERNENLRQATVYTFIGGIAAILDLFLLFVLVSLLGLYYLLAATISFILVGFFSYYCHKRFTFRHKGGRDEIRFIIFLIIALTGLVWTLALLYLFVDILKFWYLFAAVIVKFIVLVWNFLINKFVTFGILKDKEQSVKYT